MFKIMRTIASLLFFLLFSTNKLALGGTWADRFGESTLGADWRGNRDAFRIKDGALAGVSANPLAESPLNIVEVGNDWGDYVIQCWINVVSPNTHVCSKGALVLRHNGAEGYVFALHEPTQTIEVYRLSNHEMLLSKPAVIKFQSWYHVRAELKGENMSFFVDDVLVGTVTDNKSLSGATGVAVQDVDEGLFDDFTVTGPAIPSNGLETVRKGTQITLMWPKAMDAYIVKSTADIAQPPSWSGVDQPPAADENQFTLTLDFPKTGRGFYMLFPKP
jgi:hypothetical protein